MLTILVKKYVYSIRRAEQYYLRNSDIQEISVSRSLLWKLLSTIELCACTKIKTKMKTHASGFVNIDEVKIILQKVQCEF